MGERGQSIVLLAGAMVALLVFVGLAVDAGVIYMGSIHLSRAVDAAALAGVVELPDADATGSLCYSDPFEVRTCYADDKALGFLAANGISPTVAITGTEFFQSNREHGVIGSYRYRVTATHQVDLYFLPVVNFKYVKLRDTALAEYNPWVDIYTDQSGALGVLSTVNQSFKGRGEASARGDAFSPRNSFWYDELRGKYIYRIFVPNHYPHDIIRVEILDPEDYDVSFPDRVTATFFDADRGGLVTEEISCDGSTCPTGSDEQPLWFLGLDEGTSNNSIRFTLFYYMLDMVQGDGVPRRVDLAQYIGDDHDTNMRWICPPGFELSRSADLSDAYVPEGALGIYIYLEAESLGDHTENSFDLWAGPPIYDDVPDEVNARNAYIIPRGEQAHGSAGAVVYAVGHMAFNSNAQSRAELQLSDIPSSWAGRHVRIDAFDIDTKTTPPLIFYFDTMPLRDWAACYDDQAAGCVNDGCLCEDWDLPRKGDAFLVAADCETEVSNDQWHTYDFELPPRDRFYGGRLMVSYGGGNKDNVTIRIMVESPPKLAD